MVSVANRRFAGVTGLVLLAIEADRLSSELRYEAAEEGERFPHIYGPLNLDAVTGVLPFEPDHDGSFSVTGVA